MTEQLKNPDIVDDLQRSPRRAFFELRKLLPMRPELFADLKQVLPWLVRLDSQPLIESADANLYCLMRSDILLVDLGAAGYGEQGSDVLFGRLGGMPVIGITDRFQNAPSLLARLDCLICPDSIGQIVRAIELFSGGAKASASPESNEPRHDPPPAAASPVITREFAKQVLGKAGIEVESDAATDDNTSGDQVS